MWNTRRIPLCLALLAAALILFSCSGAASKWKDGDWQGRAAGIHGDVLLTVTVQKGRIAKIAIDKEEEAAGVTDLAFTRVPETIIKQQSTKVDAVSGATGSSKAIMAAVEDALTKAVKQ
jgi:uncharacterized protein with FMN-binding domain